MWYYHWQLKQLFRIALSDYISAGVRLHLLGDCFRRCSVHVRHNDGTKCLRRVLKGVVGTNKLFDGRPYLYTSVSNRTAGNVCENTSLSLMSINHNGYMYVTVSNCWPVIVISYVFGNVLQDRYW